MALIIQLGNGETNSEENTVAWFFSVDKSAVDRNKKPKGLPAQVLWFLQCTDVCLHLSSYSSSRSSKTFKPKKNIPEGSHQYELLKHAEATLGSGNLRQAVMLPEGEDLNEWIAVNSECMTFWYFHKKKTLAICSFSAYFLIEKE